MSEWEYSPIENIAFAIQEIASTLERIEKLMTPTPQGDITSTQTWDEAPVESVVEEAIEEESPSEPDVTE